MGLSLSTTSLVPASDLLHGAGDEMNEPRIIFNLLNNLRNQEQFFIPNYQIDDIFSCLPSNLCLLNHQYISCQEFFVEAFLPSKALLYQ